MRGTAFFAALCLAAAVFLAGCGAPPAQEVIPEPALSAEELPMPEGVALGQQELRISMPKTVATLHPLAVKEEDTANLLSLIVEPAIRIDSAGKFRPGVVENWQLNEETKTLTLSIRPGVKFQKEMGSVTADDLIFTLDTIREAGAEDCPYARYIDSVSTCQKKDDSTVLLTLNEKNSNVFYLLSCPVLCKKYYDGVPLDTKKLPLGSGPYAAESYEESGGMQLLRSADWWRSAPPYDSIYAVAVKDEQEKMQLFSEGDLHCVPTGLATVNNYARAGQSVVYSYAIPQYVCLVPNLSNRHLSNASVRMALSAAIDRSNLISVAMLGEGQASETPLRPDLWFFEDSISLISGYDSARAQALLKQAGYTFDREKKALFAQNGDGTRSRVKLRLLLTEDREFAYRESVAMLLSDQLGAVGIEVELDKKEGEEYREALSGGDFDLALCVFSTRTNQDLSFFFEADNNYGGYHDAALSSLIRQTRSVMSDGDLKAAYNELEAAWLDDFPNIGLFFREHALLADRSVQIDGKLTYRRVFGEIGDWKISAADA